MLTLPPVEAALFDLDGVVATTVALHEQAWRATFDPFLARTPGQRPFSAQDYRAFVDGRPREEGVRTFLAARRIAADVALCERLAHEKNAAFQRLLEEVGPSAMPCAAHLLAQLKRRGVSVGLFTASRNARRVLAALDLERAFDAVVDGEVARTEGLAGKPAPDAPLACARRLGAAPPRCVLFEDAVSGIEAGRAGAFGTVVGVGTGAQARRLAAAGADRVVASLCEIALPADAGADGIEASRRDAHRHGGGTR